MWDTLWLEVNLATMTSGGPPFGEILDGAVGIEGGRLAFVGPCDRLPGEPGGLAKEVREGRGCWMTPGLIDCHTHLVYGGNRAGEFEKRLRGVSYEEIARAGGGILSTVKATRTADEAELLMSAEERLADLRSEGVTTVEIKSGYGLNLETELKMLRVARRLSERAEVTVKTTLLGAHALPPEFFGRPDAYIDLICDEMIPAAADLNLADAVDAFCENIGFSVQQVERVFQAAGNRNLPVKLHAEQLSDQGGAALAARYGALSADHLEYVSEAGVRAMAEAGTLAVLLPGAFHMLQEKQKPPVALFRRHGVPIALSTDCNPGSSPVTSLLLMLNMACVLFGLTVEEALAGVTREAARALGMDRSHGTLEVGKVADLVLWEIEGPADLAYRLGASPCREVARNGLTVLRRG
ncbi:MAG: imidazolonepropionase [Thermoanaerobaculales bacterium]|nr:imidazolonepropionase [Thermoanaerobaculales bacterium]